MKLGMLGMFFDSESIFFAGHAMGVVLSGAWGRDSRSAAEVAILYAVLARPAWSACGANFLLGGRGSGQRKFEMSEFSGSCQKSSNQAMEKEHPRAAPRKNC